LKQEMHISRKHVSTVRRALVGKKCWYVACVRDAPRFDLALGKKIPRRRFLANPRHSTEYRRYEGEVELVVWCSWRIEGRTGPLASFSEALPVVHQKLQMLVGRRIQGVQVARPTWDLTLSFTRGLALTLFCDHVGADPFYKTNWELQMPDYRLYVCANSKVKVSRGALPGPPTISLPPDGPHSPPRGLA